MENTAKDPNKNNEIIITARKKKEKKRGFTVLKKHTHIHHKHIEKKGGHST
jgi:hypothetical protein